MDALKLLLLAAVLCMSMRTSLSTPLRANSYYSVSRKDFRRCASPACGGYFLKKVNFDNETYVYNILTGGLPKDVQATYNKFIALFPNKFDLVVYSGKLIRNAQSVKLGFGYIFDLNVTNIYLGYPGVTLPLGPSIGYYSISVSFKKAKASLLNTVKSVTVPTANVKALSLNLVDQSVQLDQILSQGALVVASAPSIKAPTVLVKQVFFKLPVTAGPCALFKIACDTPDRVIYSRTPKLCFIPKCLKQKDVRFCTLFLPICPTGYRLAAWPGPNGGCTAFACDPVFFPIATKQDLN